MKLFGKNKTEVIKGGLEILKGVRGMVDDSKFTDEERARQNSKTIDQGYELAKLHESGSTEQSLTRRWVAIILISVYAAVTIFIIVAGKFDRPWAEFAVGVLKDLQHDKAFVAIVVAFYGVHAMRTYRK